MEEETKPKDYPRVLGGCIEPAPNGMTEEEWRLKNIEYAESLAYLSPAALGQYKDLIDSMYEERTGNKLEREFKPRETEVIDEIRAKTGTSQPTHDYIRDMYKLPSEPANPFAQCNDDKKNYKYGGMMESESLKQERERRESEARAARIKLELEELDKSDWQFFKQFVKREWSAAKELWKRWRGR